MEERKDGFCLIAFEGPWHRQTIDLRRRVLRSPLGLDFSEEELRKEENQHHFAWLQSEEVKACCVLAVVGSGLYKLRQMAVDPLVQQSGFGRKLILAVENWARQEGATEIQLHARQNALPFYEKLGYTAEGEWFTEVGLPHRRMSKKLFPVKG